MIRLALPPPRLRAAPLFMRLLEAMTLRRSLYEHVAAAPDGWRAAAAVVCVSSLAYGALMGSPFLAALVETIGNWILPLILLLEVARWLIAASAAYVVSLLLARERADFGRLLRCLGLATAPKMAALLALVADESIAGWLPKLIGAWLFVSTIAAVRYALGVGLVRAVVIGVLGFVIESIFLPALGVLLVFAWSRPHSLS